MGNGFARRHDQVFVVNLALKQGRKRIDCATRLPADIFQFIKT
jgi:hypothetical protein